MDLKYKDVHCTLYVANNGKNNEATLNTNFVNPLIN